MKAFLRKVTRVFPVFEKLYSRFVHTFYPTLCHKGAKDRYPLRSRRIIVKRTDADQDEKHENQLKAEEAEFTKDPYNRLFERQACPPLVRQCAHGSDVSPRGIVHQRRGDDCEEPSLEEDVAEGTGIRHEDVELLHQPRGAQSAGFAPEGIGEGEIDSIGDHREETRQESRNISLDTEKRPAQASPERGTRHPARSELGFL